MTLVDQSQLDNALVALNKAGARIAELEAENERVVGELGRAEHMLLRYVLAEIARALGDSAEEGSE